LPVEVGEQRTFTRNPVDVGRPIAHDAVGPTPSRGAGCGGISANCAH
jgi:hypothetical protein